MSLTLATEYAILALIALAKNPQQQMKVADIAAAEDISCTYLHKISQKLVKSNIVSAKTGVKGGIRLTREPEKITLKEVIEAIQGGKLIKTLKEKNSNLKLAEFLTEAEARVMRYLKRATLSDLVKVKE